MALEVPLMTSPDSEVILRSLSQDGRLISIQKTFLLLRKYQGIINITTASLTIEETSHMPWKSGTNHKSNYFYQAMLIGWYVLL